MQKKLVRVQKDHNAIAIAVDASIEEDLKALKKLFNKSAQSQL